MILGNSFERIEMSFHFSTHFLSQWINKKKVLKCVLDFSQWEINILRRVLSIDWIFNLIFCLFPLLRSLYEITVSRIYKRVQFNLHIIYGSQLRTKKLIWINFIFRLFRFFFFGGKYKFWLPHFCFHFYFECHVDDRTNTLNFDLNLQADHIQHLEDEMRLVVWPHSKSPLQTLKSMMIWAIWTQWKWIRYANGKCNSKVRTYIGLSSDDRRTQ